MTHTIESMPVPAASGHRRSRRPRIVHCDDDSPMCRASIRDGVLTLNRWSPTLYRRGPAPAAMTHLESALADLHRLDEGELLAVPVPGSPWGPAADATLTAWAARVGYRRLWLPGHVVTLDELPRLARVAVDCPTCGARWEDETAGFWEMVREEGWFPGFCRACGGSLPEWTEASAVDEGQKVVQFERHVG